MTEINFKGKEFVYNHHLSVPFRPLVLDPDKGIGKPALDGNLIIHGDNLHALKALLPSCAGKVDCIFIDPPYNTGNEGWCYNDNVNAPMIREWLDANPVGEDDGLRHDKWCAMMWPRLRLLRELMSPLGSLWITLDDNEVHRARHILDELFGETCFVGQIAWQKRTSRENRAVLSPSFDHILVYSASHRDVWKIHRNLLAPVGDGYSNPDNDPRGQWASIPFSAQGFRANQVYEITTPTGSHLRPPKGRCWAATEPEFEKLKADGRIYWPKGGTGRPRVKQYSEEAKGLVPMTLWHAAEVGNTESSKKQLLELFADYDESDLSIHAPKPVDLVKRIIDISTRPNSIVLDSFAGTGTTAHAVLAANKADGGDRRFILVEMEDYANSLTAERVRRVSKGYSFTGKRKTELLRRRITWSILQESRTLIDEIQKIENLEGHEYDAIVKTVRDGELIVTGDKGVIDRVNGLGGTFTYCTLGDPIELDNILTGRSLPPWGQLGALLFNMATNRAVTPRPERNAEYYVGEADGQHVWLIYKPDLEWLKTSDAALTLSRASEIAAHDPDARHLVFAPARYVSQKMLAERGIPVEFAPLPFAMYRVDRS